MSVAIFLLILLVLTPLVVLAVGVVLVVWLRRPKQPDRGFDVMTRNESSTGVSPVITHANDGRDARATETR